MSVVHFICCKECAKLCTSHNKYILMGELDKVIFFEILKILPIADAISFGETCGKNNAHYRHIHLWHHWLKRDFGVTDADPCTAYREEYLCKDATTRDHMITYASDGYVIGLKCCLRRMHPDDWIFRLACFGNRIDAVRLLLADGRADPSAEDNIVNASVHGDVEIMRMLLTDKRVSPAFGHIFNASYFGHHKIVRLLLEDNRVNPGDHNNIAIVEASRSGHVEVVRGLLADKRVDPSDQTNYAIRCASGNGHVEVVRLLLTDDRVDPTANTNEAIRRAAGWYRGVRTSLRIYPEIVRLLLADKRVDAASINRIPETYVLNTIDDCTEPAAKKTRTGRRY